MGSFKVRRTNIGIDCGDWTKNSRLTYLSFFAYVGAEIEALYENTRQLLNASAAIYDEVACRCIPDLETRPQSKF